MAIGPGPTGDSYVIWSSVVLRELYLFERPTKKTKNPGEKNTICPSYSAARKYASFKKSFFILNLKGGL